MINKEKYKQAFSVLQTSRDYAMEVENMTKATKKTTMKTGIAAAVAVCVVLAGGGTAYAANVGGIQRTIQVWIHGDQTDAELEISQDGSYNLTYKDENGENREIAGGGVAMEADGTERPLTAEEIQEELASPMPEVEYEEDGTVWVYYYDQKLDITDKFEDGICYVKLHHGEKTLYVTVEYQGGYAVSEDKYPSPSEWDTDAPEE